MKRNRDAYRTVDGITQALYTDRLNRRKIDLDNPPTMTVTEPDTVALRPVCAGGCDWRDVCGLWVCRECGQVRT